MYALKDTYELDRDHNHSRKARIRAERRNFFANTKTCDRCEGFGTLIDLFSEIACNECDGIGRAAILKVV